MPFWALDRCDRAGRGRDDGGVGDGAAAGKARGATGLDLDLAERDGEDDRVAVGLGRPVVRAEGPDRDPRGGRRQPGSGYISTYASQGYGYAWSGMGGLFRRDDLTVVNVECPVTDEGAQLSKEFSFHGTPAALPAMRDAGVEVGSLANNHAYDRGPDGVVDSRQQAGGSRHRRRSGPGRTRTKRSSRRCSSERLDGRRPRVRRGPRPLDAVAGPNKPGTAAGHDFSLMVRAVKDAAERADLVVVMIHWGVELDTQPRRVPGRGGTSADRRRRGSEQPKQFSSKRQIFSEI